MKISYIVTYNASSKCLTANLTKLSGSTTKASDGDHHHHHPFVKSSVFLLWCSLKSK